MGDIDEFSADVKKAVAEKKLRYISAEFWEDDKRDGNESPYLKAVALLGRDTPAVPGAKLPSLFDRSGGVMSTLDEKEFVTAFTRKIGAEDKAAFESASPAAPGASGRPADSAETNQFHQEGTMDDEKLKSLEAELAAAKAQIAAFQKENESLRDNGRKADAQTFFSKLRDEGKITPAHFEKAVALDARLGEEERKEYRALFAEAVPQADLSGTHAAPKSKAPQGGGISVSARIRAFQKEKGVASFADAAEAFYAENPAAFDEGGAE